jgi:DNA repair exonuclease SbcCD ATPase subunit
MVARTFCSLSLTIYFFATILGPSFAQENTTTNELPAALLSDLKAEADSIEREINIIQSQLEIARTRLNSQASTINSEISLLDVSLDSLESEISSLEAKRFTTLKPFDIRIENPTVGLRIAEIRRRQEVIRAENRLASERKSLLDKALNSVAIADDALTEISTNLSLLKVRLKTADGAQSSEISELSLLMTKIRDAIAGIRSDYSNTISATVSDGGAMTDSPAGPVQNELDVKRSIDEEVRRSIEQLWNPKGIWGGS